MNQGLKQFSYLLLLTLLANSVMGQKELSLPKLTPSSIEDFSEYSSFPSLCFEDVWEDQSGRLWLKVCDATRVSGNVHLFQFDGYSFKLIEDALTQINEWDVLTDIYQGKKIVGYRYGPDISKIFFYDLYQKEIQFYDAPLNSKIVDIKVSNNEDIFVSYELNGKIHLAQWEEQDFKIQGEFEDSIVFAPGQISYPIQFLHHDKDEFWAAMGEVGYLLKIDKKTNQKEKISLNNFLENNQQVSAFYNRSAANHIVFKSIKLEENIYLLSKFTGKNHFFKWNKQSNEFSEIKDFPKNWTGQDIFKDKIGNLLFLFKDAEQKSKAILQDTSGNRFDYSAFIIPLKSKIQKVYSTDFKKNIIFCLDSGVIMAKVKASEAIQHFLPNSSIRAMVELKNGNVLVNTQFKDLHIIDPNNNKVTPISTPDSCDFSWTRITSDKIGNIWTATKDYIFRHSSNITDCEIYSSQSDKIRFFTFISQYKIALINYKEQLYFYDLKTRQTTPFLENNEIKTFSGFTNEIIYDSRNFIWIATSKSLFKVNLKTGIAEDIGATGVFQSTRFLSMYLDKKGKLWLGTTLHGIYIYDPDTGFVKNLNNEDGLPNNTIASFIEDDDGDIWVSTYNGISLVSSNGQLITNIYEKDGLVNRENNRYATLKTKDGKLFIGTINGLNYINPDKIKERLIGQQDLKIYANNIRHYDQASAKDTTIAIRDFTSPTIELPASRRFLNIDFALSNYFNSKENQYAYMLEGVDNKWIDIGNQRFLNLNNLPAGDYRLLIKGSDGRGNWTKEPLAISIQADAVFYKQLWFYLLASLLVIGGALLWITRLRKEVNKATKKIRADKNIIEQQAEREKARAEKMEQQAQKIEIQAQELSQSLEEVKEKNEEILVAQKQLIQQEKLATLGQITAGIAHEIKNPLNFVNNFAEGSLDILKELKEELENNSKDIPKDSTDLIQSLIEELSQNAVDIQANGTRVDRIIRSMMDHARGTNSEIRPVDLKQLIEDNISLAYHGYRALEPGFNVHIKNNMSPDLPLINIYPHEMGRVLLNILNNACYAVLQKQKKLGHDYNAKIEVNTTNLSDHIEIKIKDNGPGIKAEVKEKIFDPFFTTKATGAGNTGLGLSISYDIIVNRHDGKLSVDSVFDQFTEFCILMPKKPLEN